MALLIRGQLCPLCDKPILEHEPIFDTWGVWLRPEDPMFRFCDACMHSRCYASWPLREQFAASYFEFWNTEELWDPYWHRAFLDGHVLVTVGPMERAWVHLRATGARMSVKLANWERWLASGDDEREPALLRAIVDAKRALAAAVPTAADLVNAIDWQRKLPAIDAYRKQREDAEVKEKATRTQMRERTRRYNDACERAMFRIRHRGLVCPHCGKHSKDFRLTTREGAKSAIICRGCGWVIEPETAMPKISQK